VAWWGWLLVGWAVVAPVAAFLIGASARAIKRAEAEDATRAGNTDVRWSAARPPRSAARHWRRGTHAETTASSTSAVTPSPPSST
jgi:hypothetical protein